MQKSTVSSIYLHVHRRYRHERWRKESETTFGHLVVGFKSTRNKYLNGTVVDILIRCFVAAAYRARKQRTFEVPVKPY